VLVTSIQQINFILCRDWN